MEPQITIGLLTDATGFPLMVEAQRDSIEAQLAIVFAALAVTRLIEDRTGWSINKFVRTARRYRTVEIAANQRGAVPQLQLAAQSLAFR